MLKKILSLTALALIACTQIIEEDILNETAYTGDDGCIYCHTNKSRLQALAPELEDDNGGGGG